ncbi:MAG: RHS repeat-associated core domain-containing protein [Planctomycetaceae bacterium]|nr:RHS repeat-associated core domain-containing protein [Planctomycetaceae bacterium]
MELYAFDAYGNAIGFDPTTALTEFLYSGEQFDSKIGQQYLRARYYDPATGRFNRLDPFFGNLNDPQSLHKYLYTHADPVNGIDPSGKFLIGLSLSMFFGSALRSKEGATIGVGQQLILGLGAVAAGSGLGYIIDQFAYEKGEFGYANTTYGAQLGFGLYVAMRQGKWKEALSVGVAELITDLIPRVIIHALNVHHFVPNQSAVAVCAKLNF